MTRFLVCVVAVSSIVLGTAAPSSGQPILYGAANTRDPADPFQLTGPATLYRIDAGTALATPVGTGIGFDHVGAMDFAPDPVTGEPKLYAVGRRGGTYFLLTINTSTGEGTPIAPVGFVGSGVSDLAFRASDGLLYGRPLLGGVPSFGGIDRTTGAVTVPSVRIDDGIPYAHAFTTNDRLMTAFDAGCCLATFLPPQYQGMSTGIVLDYPVSLGHKAPNGRDGRVPRINAMKFNPENGRLYGSLAIGRDDDGLGHCSSFSDPVSCEIENYLVTIEPVSGTVIIVGRTVDGLNAIAWPSRMVETTRVTTHSADQFDPAISGTRVAFTDARNQATDGFDVYFVDLATMAETRVAPFSGGQDVEEIGGDFIVYKQTTGSEWDIWYYDIGTGTSGTVSGAAGSQTNPAISGSRVVWQDSRNGNADIYTTLIGSGVEEAVTNAAGNQVNPAVSGELIVWQDGRERGISLYDIYARNPAGAEILIAGGPTNQTNPDVSARVIVWEQTTDVYLWIGGTTHALTADAALQSRPRISGRHIVWEHDNGADTDLYGCRWAIDTAGTFSCPVIPVVVGPEDQFLHDVDGGKIAYTAWMDDDGDGVGNLDIFVTAFPGGNTPPGGPPDVCRGVPDWLKIPECFPFTITDPPACKAPDWLPSDPACEPWIALFDEVIQAGHTSLTVNDTGPPPPAGFRPGEPPTYVDLTTTAAFSGSVGLCLHYGGTSFGNESALRLFHFEAGAWVDRTESLDTSADTICGRVNAFSPFAIFEPADTTPPVISASLSVPANAAGWHNVDVTVTWSVADDESGIASSSGCDTTTVTTDTAGITLTCSATNGAGLSASESVTLKIDKTPPVVACSASPDSLQSPNHKLVEINVAVSVSDALSGEAGFLLDSVASSEPDDETGDGATPHDMQGFQIGTPDTGGWLRAERSGTGSGRVYTLGYVGKDQADNVASCAATVSVPHDRR